MKLIALALLLLTVSCGKDGKDGVNGKDLSIESKVYCSGMFNDHPSYFGVYPAIEITFFSNKTFMIHASVSINDSLVEFQETSNTVWGKGVEFPFVSVLNIEFWYFDVESVNGNDVFTLSNQSGSYTNTLSNCYTF